MAKHLVWSGVCSKVRFSVIVTIIALLDRIVPDERNTKQTDG